MPTVRCKMVLLLLVTVVGGCTSLAERIAEPHSKSLLDAETVIALEKGMGLEQSHLATSEGIRIAFVRFPAISRHYEYSLSLEGNSADISFKTRSPFVPVPFRGSIVYLHGWSMDGTTLWPWALTFAERGYEGYVLDLRNHGRSDRAPEGFGMREAVDVISVVEQLQDQGLLRPPVFLFGVSMGASTALFAEPELRKRVTGIVAIEPFANAADAIGGVIDRLLTEPPAGVRSRLWQALARWRYGGTGKTQAAIAAAGRRLDIDLEAVDLGPVANQTRTCTLLLHGAADKWLDPVASRQLAAKSPLIQYVLVPGMDHVSLPMRADWLAEPMLQWFDKLANGHCGLPALPPDPVAQ